MKLRAGFLFLGLSFALAAATAQADPGSCALTTQEFRDNIGLDYQHFDQDLSAGDGGWRAIANRGCYLEAATLIETYHLQNLATLADYQDRILWWHAGQLYALDDIYPSAILRFQKSYDKETPGDPFKWNAYVDASVAFLQGDLQKLKQARDVLATATAPGAQINLKIVDAFIRCFGKPYSQAYNPSCN